MVNRLYGIGAVLAAALVVLYVMRTQVDEQNDDSVNDVPPADCMAPIPTRLLEQPRWEITTPQTGATYQSLSCAHDGAGRQPSYVAQPIPQCQSSSVAVRMDANPPASYQDVTRNEFPSLSTPLIAPIAAAQPFVGDSPPAEVPTDGTWQDDGHYVILKMNGKVMKFLKSSSVPPQSDQGMLASFDNSRGSTEQLPQPNASVDDGVFLLPPATPETIGAGSVLGEDLPAADHPLEGIVHGRLLQKGYPVSNCYVVIAPWPKGDKADSSLDTRVPLTTMTNDAGFYCFEHVLPGEYKLTWLPAGTQQWIRRIAMRPDVIVHEGQDVTLKDIRMALQTIN